MSEAIQNRSEAFRKSMAVDEPKMKKNKKPRFRPNTFIPKKEDFFNEKDPTVKVIYNDDPIIGD